MMRVLFFMLAVLFFLSFFSPLHGVEGAPAPGKEGESLFGGRNISDAYLSTGISCLATDSDLYVSRTGQSGWDTAFSLPPSANAITSVAVNGQTIFVGTKAGLYGSKDGGISWKRVFHSFFKKRSLIRAIAICKGDPMIIAAGTAEGLYISRDGGERWSCQEGVSQREGINAIILFRGEWMAAGDHYCYFSKDEGAAWIRSRAKSGITLPEESGEISGDDLGRESAAISGDAYRALGWSADGIVVSSGKELYRFSRQERDWKCIPTDGIGSVITCVLVRDETHSLYVGTESGVYEYRPAESRWAVLGNVSEPKVNRLQPDQSVSSFLWAATERGFIRIETEAAASSRREEVEGRVRRAVELMSAEPSIDEVQADAIAYAAVAPERFERWERLSKLRALVPKLSTGVGETVATNAEIYTSATREYVTIGPDDRSHRADISLSWDLANLVWSNDETSIDIRARMASEMRNEILEEVRRAYFERKKLIFETAQIQVLENRSRFERDLRIQELTAVLDGFTGGLFSKKGTQEAMDGGKMNYLRRVVDAQ